ncbi:peptide deformylase [Aestuariivita sp.]|jgi:peptide deformylase|uniref:peptide deformylase n=1 Tax=Aestuariivita sp. TaxID=1872407 RepID=UPI00216EAF88|nr:peptide deformylase [Aestuariivita sp.]MCE8007319.1 peptide deformylase [Aestuariivita sp.]
MSILPIVTWPDPRLSEMCTPVGQVTSAIRQQAEDMLETMYDAPGRGLAAPQVGVMNRLFVTDFTWKDGQPDPQVFLNPEILDASSTLVETDEGCLSIPGVTTRVARPDRVHFVWTSLDGARVSQVLTGFAAACVQHELDHLNGIVTLDRLSPEDRARAEEAYSA